jgi:type I restriction enzyme R subunit
MTDEEHRSVREEMSEEQLAVYDLLCKEDLEEADEKEIKKIAKELLDIVKGVTESSVNRWEKDQTQAEVKVTIEKYLYTHLPTSYDLNLLKNKTDELYMYMYQHMRVI